MAKKLNFPALAPDSAGHIYNWAVSNLEEGYYPNTATFGIFYAGELAGAVIFSQENARNVYLSIYSEHPKWCSKKVLKFVHGFCFKVLGASVITAMVSAQNVKSQNLVRRLGFELKGVITAGRKDGKDCLVYQCLENQYKYKG